tara:strand:- start:45 stop:938 length:894 start_codon:yes stop_codon:yes gene_type:complete
MAFKMKGSPMYRNFGIGTPMKTGHPSQKTPQGEDLIAGDKNFTKKEQRKDARLEDKNNDAAARREYMEMMKAKKSPLKDRGHGKGKNHTHGRDGDGIPRNIIGRANANDPRSQLPNAKKLAKKTTKAKDTKEKASAANANLTRKYVANMDSGKGWKEMSGKDRRETKSLGRKADRANKKANVADSVKKYQGRKVGNYMDKADTKVMKTGKGLKVTLPGRTNVDRKNIKYGVKPGKGQTWGGNAGKRKFGKKKGSIEVVDKERVDIGATHKQRKKYRQNKGLRGAVNARRTGKGKDKI